MKFDRNALIGGQRVMLVRNFLRRHWRRFTLGEVVAYLGKTDERMSDMTAPAQALFDQLLADGYIEPNDDRPEDYKATMKGRALAQVKFIRRINRAKAEALLNGVLERVAAINVDPEMLLYVTEVRVFGSYLTDTDDLGDLDLAVKYDERREQGHDQLKAYRAACAALAKLHGREINDVDRLHSFAKQLVRSRVKNGSHHISLHETDELDNNPALGGKTVYTFTPPAKAEH
jgi:predicted nucleotidyltransferase